jgi:hypothetical protein
MSVVVVAGGGGSLEAGKLGSVNWGQGAFSFKKMLGRCETET